MKAMERQLFKRFQREQIERAVADELSFHVDLLTEEHIQGDLPPAAARDAALKRFGNLEQIKEQCVEIRSTGHPLVRALKAFLIPVFLLGVLVRIFGAEFHATPMGNLLMLVAFLGRLLLYVRGLNPASLNGQQETSSPLRLNEGLQRPITAYETKQLSPVERVISNLPE
jgi:hypothetical protein